MTSTRNVKVGLIGAGVVVRTLHAPLLKGLSDVDVSWVYDADLGAARRVASAFDLVAAHDDLTRCADVDAVLIAIPVGVRDAAWRAAAERGWHVLCEKPAATTLQEFDAIVGRMKEAGLVTAFGFMRRFYQGVRCLRELVTARAFGEPLEVWAGEGGAQPRTGRGEDWYQLDRRLSAGGVLIETGSHLLDQMVFITGPTTACVDDYRQQTWKDAPEFDARVYGRLQRSDGCELPFSCVVSRSADVCNGLFVRYERAVLALPPGPAAEVELRDADNNVLGRIHGASDHAVTSFQAFRDEWVDFLESCRRGERAEDRSARLSMALIDGCYRRVVDSSRDSVGAAAGLTR
jgi:predicted dehydrogenase